MTLTSDAKRNYYEQTTALRAWKDGHRVIAGNPCPQIRCRPTSAMELHNACRRFPPRAACLQSRISASPGIERVEYLSTNQMCIAELQALREFASNGKSDDEPQFLPQVDEPEEDPIHESAAEPATEPAEDPKPKANGNVRITGYEMLERKIRAVEPPI